MTETPYKNMQPALFLDRDGVINVNHGYVYQIESFDFIPGIFELVRQAKDLGLKTIVVTNQSGIGRGYYTEDDFHTLTAWMKNEFEKNGGHIDDVYFCPYHPTKAKGKYLKDSNCRKPKTGMFENAIEEHQIDVSKSIAIGDKKIDMVAASSIGIKDRLLFSQDQSQSSNYETCWLNKNDLKNIDLKALIASTE